MGAIAVDGALDLTPHSGNHPGPVDLLARHGGDGHARALAFGVCLVRDRVNKYILVVF